jgi:hypothetical protein
MLSELDVFLALRALSLLEVGIEVEDSRVHLQHLGVVETVAVEAPLAETLSMVGCITVVPRRPVLMEKITSSLMRWAKWAKNSAAATRRLHFASSKPCSYYSY